MVRVRLVSALGVAALGGLLPLPAQAFCRATTGESAQASCPQVCFAEGYPLFWPKRQLGYVLREGGVPGLSEEELRGALARAFGAWTSVECDQRPIDLTIEQAEGTTELGARPKELMPEVSVVAYVPADDWDDDPHAFAITNLRYNARNGQILGADLLLNGGRAPFVVCPDEGCPDETVSDLPNVVTHEVGHFLGLAHSPVAGSTMWCEAQPGDVDKRSLEGDDIAGVCAIYGPDPVLGPPPSGVLPDAALLCQSSPWAPASGGALGLLFTLAGWALSRRRR